MVGVGAGFGVGFGVVVEISLLLLLWLSLWWWLVLLLLYVERYNSYGTCVLRDGDGECVANAYLGMDCRTPIQTKTLD